eukprot:TRINITY_DN4069_c0_g2_i1.p1 TRINITY_DN4069_c0_g2~~TRINITY_DN4069_c0_g2_i1.p1  ORF type:complete len:216 (-),score=74.50 TRINITY_DN4069_c0_g2_i1:11-658(-)
MIRRPPRSTPKPSSAASDVYKRQVVHTPENLIFSIGGIRSDPLSGADVPINTIFLYIPKTQSYRLIGEFGKPRKGFGVIRILQSIYIIAGSTTLECERFDYMEKNVVSIAPATLQSVAFALCEFEQKYIYRFVYTFNAYKTRQFANNELIERYHIYSNTWEIINLPSRGEYEPDIGIGCICLNSSEVLIFGGVTCLLYTSPSPRDLSTSRMPSSA